MPDALGAEQIKRLVNAFGARSFSGMNRASEAFALSECERFGVRSADEAGFVSRQIESADFIAIVRGELCDFQAAFAGFVTEAADDEAGCDAGLLLALF